LKATGLVASPAKLAAGAAPTANCCARHFSC